MVFAGFRTLKSKGPHGYTQRDIVRRWSVATPLERELQPFTISEFEPVSDYVGKIFRFYCDLRARVLTWLHDKSVKRAELANRWRAEKAIKVGMRVVCRDPRQRKAGGRTPYKQPSTRWSS